MMKMHLKTPQKSLRPSDPQKRPKTLVAVSKETPQNSRKFTNPIFRLTTEKPPFFRNLPYAPYPPGGVGGGCFGGIFSANSQYIEVQTRTNLPIIPKPH